MKKKIKKRSVKNVIEKEKEFSFQEEVNSAWRYLKDSDNYVAVVVGVFVLFFMFGFIFPYIAPPELLNPILDQIRELIEQIIKETEGKGFVEMWAFIFWNNVSIAFFAAMFGFFFAIVPIFLLMSNGVMIGLISSLVTREVGLFSLWRLLPHGVFEIPAIIISFAIGIKFGAFIFNKNIGETFFERLKGTFRVFFLIIVPLLVLAAIIEAALIVYVG